MIIGRTFTALILIINIENWFKNMPSWLKDALITRNKYCQSNHVIVSWKVYHSFIFFLKDHEPNELIKLWSDHPAYTIRFFYRGKRDESSPSNLYNTVTLVAETPAIALVLCSPSIAPLFWSTVCYSSTLYLRERPCHKHRTRFVYGY